MGRKHDGEEAWWLGGEAQVYPCMDERKPISLLRVISGGMFLLAGLGIGRLATIRSQRGEHRWQQDHYRNVEAHRPSERGGTMEQQREMGRSGGSRTADGLGVVTILAAFGLGLMAGAVTALLTTPESGPSVCNRLKRGVDTARKEFDETVGEAKQDWSAVSEEICDSVKRTASRVKQVAEVTKDALIDGNGVDVSVRRAP